MNNNSVLKSGIVRPPYQQVFAELVEGLALLEVLEVHDTQTLEYRFLQVNKAWQEQTGIPAEQTLGKNIAEVFPAMEDNGCDLLNRVYHTGQPACLNDFNIKPDSYYRVSIFKPHVGLLALLLVDSTEHTVVEQQLKIRLERIQRSRQRTVDRLRKEIKKRRIQKKQLFLADSVFLYSAEGICITNTNGVIERVNPAFTVITGYTSKEVVGKNPSILNSNYHSTRFYEEMWHRLKTQGSWCGEIWNRRKNGEIYPEYLAITAVTDEHDKITHYVALFHDRSELKASEEKLVHQSLHDALTGLPNRRLFIDHCDLLFAQALQHGTMLAVILLDIDDFKNINESLGYAVGDLVLQHVAARIKDCLRAQDVIARMGGDKFILLISDVEKPDDVLMLASRVMEKLNEAFTVHDHRIFLKVSLGISYFPEHGKNSQTLLQKAEMALYKAKELGKSRIFVFCEEISELVRRRIGLLHKMRLALEREEFELYYQPKVRFDTFRITGVEALIRWKTSDNQIVGPDEFIPLVEQSNLIIELGGWVIEEACRWLRIWRDHGHAELTMAVNLSTRQFLDPDLVEKIFSAVDRNHLSVDLLHLEITEHTMVEHMSKSIAIMERLAEYGFSISIDDFGTGFSSLAYLKRFPITTLKIDRSFIKDLPYDSHDQTIVRLVMSLAKSLDMSVVAEGVETREQLDFLRQLHCDEFQGYLCSPPLPPDEFEQVIEKNRVWSLEKEKRLPAVCKE